jgi:hypothetical protein
VELDDVPGVGHARAVQIRAWMDRAIDSAGFWGPSGGHVA